MDTAAETAGDKNQAETETDLLEQNRMLQSQLDAAQRAAESAHSLKESRLRKQYEDETVRTAALRQVIRDAKAAAGTTDKDRLITQLKRENAELSVEARKLRKEIGMRAQQQGAGESVSADAINSANDLLRFQTMPFIADCSDAYLVGRWQALYDRVLNWAHLGYRNLGEITVDVDHSAQCNDNLYTIYGREISNRSSTFLDFAQGSRKRWPELRTLVCVGLVFRILHEEVFEALRDFLKIQFPDPQTDWMYKEQPVAGWMTGTKRDTSQADGEWSRAPSCWKGRKLDEIHRRVETRMRPPVETRMRSRDPPVDRGNIRRFRDRGKMTEQDLTCMDLMNTPRPSRILSRDIFREMESRRDNHSDMMLFNTQRAKMMRTLFTMEDDPLYPQMREWRARVVNLVFDTLEPFRARSRAADSDELPSRHSLKAELWGIVKDAFGLGVTMRTQRSLVFTRFRPPIEDYTFDAATMRNFPDDPAPDVAPLLRRLAAVPVGFESSPVGKVLLAVTPQLLRVGANTDFTCERLLVKGAVVARVGEKNDMLQGMETEGFDELEREFARARREHDEYQAEQAEVERVQKEAAAAAGEPGEWNPYQDHLIEDRLGSIRDMVPENVAGG